MKKLVLSIEELHVDSFETAGFAADVKGTVQGQSVAVPQQPADGSGAWGSDGASGAWGSDDGSGAWGSDGASGAWGSDAAVPTGAPAPVLP